MKSLDTLEVRRDLFPPVVESSTVVGEITAAAAEETGLAAGTPVCAGAGDMACMAVGGGVIKPGVANVGIGTAGHALAFAEDRQRCGVQSALAHLPCGAGEIHLARMHIYRRRESGMGA